MNTLNFTRASLFLVFFSFIHATELNEKPRTWTRADGQKAQGKLVEIIEDKISLEIRGKVFEFPLSDFSRDGIKDAQLWFKEGRFEPSRWVDGRDEVGQMERVLDAIVLIKTSATEELCEQKSTSNDPRIAVSPGANAPLGIIAQVTAVKDTSKLANWMLEYQGGDPGDIKNREKSVDPCDSIAYFAENTASKAQAFYDNDSYEGIKKAQIKKSITVKGLLGAEQTGMKIKFSSVFEFWNCWTLTGKINEFSELLNQ
jgi:hypothetical protein